MLSTADAPEMNEDQPPPSPSASSTSAASLPPIQADPTASIGPGESMGCMEKMMQAKLRARGLLPPGSPPPRPKPAMHPLARELLDASGKVIYEKFGHSCSLIKHACGTKISKFHHGVTRPSEAEAMRFVSEHTSIPLPRLYHVDVEGRYFTMDFIEGEALDTAWENTLSDDDRALVARQLRDYINQLRAIKSPDGVICAFGGRPAIDSRRYLHEGGPFDNEAAYNEFLTSDLVGHSSVRDMIRTQMRSDHEIVLTHGDLHSSNIVVRPGVGVVAIIDWELAGYYPEYIELMKPFRPADWDCGYYRELLNIFPQRYDAEFIIDSMLTTWSRH